MLRLVVLSAITMCHSRHVLPSLAVAKAIAASSLLATSVVCGGHTYAILREVGDEGGSGTGRVYSARSEEGDSVAIKQSWPRRVYLSSWRTSSGVVAHECSVLRATRLVPGVERCLASSYDPLADQTTLVLSPLFVGATNEDANPDTSSLASIRDPSLRDRSTRRYLTTVVSLLLDAKVASPDVQLLVNSSSGEFLVIDFTEARQLGAPVRGRLSKEDLSLVRRFLHSALARVPVASSPILTESLRAAALDSRCAGELREALLDSVAEWEGK